MLTGPELCRQKSLGTCPAVTIAAHDISFRPATLQGSQQSACASMPTTTSSAPGKRAGQKNVWRSPPVADGMGFWAQRPRRALSPAGLPRDQSPAWVVSGGRRDTFAGYLLTGLGDLVLTCTGDLSRNRRVGRCSPRARRCQIFFAALGHVARAHDPRSVGTAPRIWAGYARFTRWLSRRGQRHRRPAMVEQLLACDPKQE